MKESYLWFWFSHLRAPTVTSKAYNRRNISKFLTAYEEIISYSIIRGSSCHLQVSDSVPGVFS